MTTPSTPESLLGRVFDQYQNMMQIARCVREMARQCAVTRPKVLELSRRPTGLEDYLPDAEIVRCPTHTDERPDLPVVLPFPDDVFDVCLVTDAYEHVPADQRPGLLREMTRVTRRLVLLGCPIRSELVTRFDRVVFDFIWGKYGERFEPLRQHVEFGLEPLEQVLASFAGHGADRAVALPCNYVYRWIHQILVYFDLQHRHPRLDLYEPLNRIYNERLTPYDYREPCYRYLVTVALDPRLDVDTFVATLQGPCETPASVAEAEGALVAAFRTVESRLGDELRAQIATITELHREQARMVGEIDFLNKDRVRLVDEIDRLTRDVADLRRRPWRTLLERWRARVA